MQTKPPRADVLWYPRSGTTTILVRRTHDVAAARELADQRWAQLADEVTAGRPLGISRVGWWVTQHTPPEQTPSTALVRAAALDLIGRVVTWTEDDRLTGAGPGVEFRP